MALAVTGVLAAAFAVTGSASAGAATTQTASCVDGGGVRWTAKVIWDSIYSADDVTKVVIDYAGWTTSRAGTVPTDSWVRSYDGASNLLRTLTWTGNFDYVSGTVYKVRNPKNFVSALGPAKLTVTLGLAGDGFGNCTVTFTQPSTSSTPTASTASSTPTPSSTSSTPAASTASSTPTPSSTSSTPAASTASSTPTPSSTSSTPAASTASSTPTPSSTSSTPAASTASSTPTPSSTSSTPAASTASSTPTPSSTACTGQAITPAINVQTAVNNAPIGTTFCFSPGTYNLAIMPKSGQVFDGGNRAAILDGQNVRQYAFRAPNTSNVTIRGFVVQNYKTPLQEGAIHAFDTTGWTIENNHIRNNAATGVATDTRVKVLNNLINHNGQQGYAAHGDNILYEGNEISYNNENLAVDATWEAGGGKSWETRYAVFRNNYVHHNGGNGLWDDTNNIHITYDRNTVANNWGAGIYHEIGYDATITNNVLTNNGTSTSQGGGQRNGWLWDAGIQLRSSGGLTSTSPILISGNTVTNNYNGISLLDSPAAGCTNTYLNEGAYGPCRIQNILVQNNVVTMNQGGTGVVQDGSGNGVFTSQNVRFQNNTYHVSNTAHPYDGHAYGWFAWNNNWPSWTGWKASGNDTSGSLGP